MGLLEQLAAAAIRNNVISTLRANCPGSLSDALEQLLADKEAITAIQGLVMGAMKNPDTLTREAFANLPFSTGTADLLKNTPELIDYLRTTALSKLKR